MVKGNQDLPTTHLWLDTHELLGLNFFFDAGCDFELYTSTEEVVNHWDCVSSHVISV